MATAPRARVGALALAVPAAAAGTALPPATIVFAALGLAVLALAVAVRAGGRPVVAALAARRSGLVAVAVGLLGTAYAAGLPAGLDAWSPLHAGALVAVAELAERSARPWGPGARHVLAIAGGATAAAALALGVAAIDSRPGAALRLAAIAAAGAALVVAARVVSPGAQDAGRRAELRDPTPASPEPSRR